MKSVRTRNTDWDHALPDWGQIKDEDLRPISSEWTRLLAKPKPREQSLHAFLAKHAQLAFRDEFYFATAISKLRLGAELVTDFVSVYDNHSAGIRYKLIEIEKPQTVPFTKEGIPSSGLARAIQQILSWRQWLDEHQSEARRLFPSLFHRYDLRPIFRYEIIIGNRTNSESWIDRRNMLAESLGISIRSFDCFSPRFRSAIEFRQFSDIGDEKHFCDLETRNQLACPFVGALTDPEWRDMLDVTRRSSTHFMHWYGRLLAHRRKENAYAGYFRRLLQRRERKQLA
jgi:hypothetical protein